MTEGGRTGLGVRGNKLQYKELEEFCIKLVELSGGMGEMSEEGIQLLIFFF